MKTTTRIISLVVLALFVLTAGTGFAQQADQKQDQQKYRIKIIKDENGKKEVVDKAFTTKAEMDAYLKENNIEAVDGNDLPPLGAGPQSTTTGNKTKKIIINESSSEATGGATTLDVTYQNFTPDERAQLIQGILNAKSPDVKLEINHQRKIIKTVTIENADDNQPPNSVNEPGEPVKNITDVKVFPNPATGQFHVVFTVSKPVNIAMRLTDLNGKEVYAGELNNYSGKFDKELNGNGTLAAGTYILDVQGGNEHEVFKVVMQ